MTLRQFLKQEEIEVSPKTEEILGMEVSKKYAELNDFQQPRKIHIDDMRVCDYTKGFLNEIREFIHYRAKKLSVPVSKIQHRLTSFSEKPTNTVANLPKKKLKPEYSYKLKR